ncbi:MAG: outer membrane lipoprotein chaperone LolA [Thiotrichales bacterium]|nr:MAG: outer membrane lipoprotein chaperone LolA [Thiotrichales bacterium]
MVVFSGFHGGYAHAGEGRVLLDRFLSETTTMTANFTQTLKSSDGEVLQESAGEFYLQRPGRFRWNYTEPYPQEIVSDGEQVWIYDVDLEQVTVQKQGTGRDNTPMALLQNRQKLEEAFEIHERGFDSGLHRIELLNKKLDSDFDRVMVGLDDTGLRFLQLHDQFEQTTYILFTDLKSNPELESTIFEFVPPEGVDVFGGS